VKIKTAEAYLARYKKRGEQAGKKRFSDFQVPSQGTRMPWTDGLKPDHQSRALNIKEYFLKVWERKTKKTEEVEDVARLDVDAS